MYISPLVIVATAAYLLKLEEHQEYNPIYNFEGFSCFSVLMIDVCELHPIYEFDSLSWVTCCVSLRDARVSCVMFHLVSRWALQRFLKLCKEPLRSVF